MHLHNWFNGLSCSVMCKSLIETPFRVHCAIHQDGVLLPLLFAIYVDDLITELRKSGYSLHIGNMFMGAILYDDIIVLLACSCCGLQKLTDICIKYGLEWI